ncbi:MAG: hypothetical protein PF542_00125 [Nanoarchaeota archaeon]|jgi:hypothetical protein|nr:hypothetical protein [Nanoarchaeota archaeon]
MKQLLLIILLIPIISAQTIHLDYPSKSSQENITFNLELKDFPAALYDVKIDITQNNKRISKIWDEKWKSSMYYINDVHFESNTSTFLLTVSDTRGLADIVVKIRNSKKEIFIFENYSIELQKIITQESPLPSISATSSSHSSKNRPVEESTNQTSLPKQTNFTKKEFSPSVANPIHLNPKTIKTKENTEKVQKGYAKYSIFGFCLLLLVMYKIKPNKKQNEFGITKTKNQFDYDY